MPQVAVLINGKTYRMACDEGQEAHLLDLAKRFDTYINQLKGSFGEIGDQRLTVMAGVMVVDKLVEMQHQLTGLESELAKYRVEPDSAREQQITKALNETSERIEDISKKLKNI